MKATHEAYPLHTYSNSPRTHPSPFHTTDTFGWPSLLSLFQFAHFGRIARRWLWFSLLRSLPPFVRCTGRLSFTRSVKCCRREGCGLCRGLLWGCRAAVGEVLTSLFVAFGVLASFCSNIRHVERVLANFESLRYIDFVFAWSLLGRPLVLTARLPHQFSLLI